MATDPARVDLPLDTVGTDPEAATQQALGPYLRSVRRHWILVAALSILAAVVGGITIYGKPQSYQAVASILVTPLPQGDPDYIGTGMVLDTGDPARTVQTAAALLSSSQAATLAARTLGTGWSTSRVQGGISVTPLGQSDLLAVAGTANSASDAAALANAFARAALTIRGRVVQQSVDAEIASLTQRIALLQQSGAQQSAEVGGLVSRIAALRAAKVNGGDPTLSLSQAALPPSSPSGAPRWLIVLLALIGGFALASVAALGLDFFSRSVRDEDELLHIFPVPVLASIPHMRHPADMPLPPSAFNPASFEQMRMLRVQLASNGLAPVTMVTSAGPGDGKTTIVAALAAALDESGQKVILMDLDFRKPRLAATLGLPTDLSGRATTPGSPLGSMISVPNFRQLKLLPIPRMDISSIDRMLEKLARLMTYAQQTGSWVILDTAPVGQVSESVRITQLCQSVLFVARLNHTDRRSIGVARDLLQRARAPVSGMIVVDRQGPLSDYYYGYGDDEEPRGIQLKAPTGD